LISLDFSRLYEIRGGVSPHCTEADGHGAHDLSGALAGSGAEVLTH
jgi:hypothetical protein